MESQSDPNPQPTKKKKERPCKQKKCKFCSSIFESLQEYVSHIESKHQNADRTCFMCSDCGKQVKTKTELAHHIDSKCGTVKNYKCNICGQDLMSAGSLYNHLLRHDEKRSFMCRFCAKLFFTAGQLKVHERIHTQDKAYVCEVCNKGFCHRQSLITHSTLHTGIKPYQCENCGNSFSCVGNLIKHRKTHADTCGLIPLTTHRVQHPSTKIKVKINTPANSRLKTKQKAVELLHEIDFVKTELLVEEDNVETFKEHNFPTLTEDNFPIFTDDNFPTFTEDNFATFKENNVPAITQDNAATITEDNVGAITEDNDPTIAEDNVAKITEDNVATITEDNFVRIKEESPPPVEFVSVNDVATQQDFEGTPPVEVKIEEEMETPPKLVKKKRAKPDPEFENTLLEFAAETNFGKEGVGACKYCGKVYTNLRWFYRHVEDHKFAIKEKAPVPTHKCSCCKMTFFTKDESLLHQRSTHADLLTCPDCSKIFANRDSLRSHQNVFHKGIHRKGYSYMCDKCGKQFKHKSYLTVHEELNCLKGATISCDVCEKKFQSKYTRNNHMRIHDPEKKYYCKCCGKSFHWKGQLKIHERSHTGEKPFACLYCPKTFAYRASLITHSTIHTGIKPHMCDSCGSRFSCIGNLIKHRVTHARECGVWEYRTKNE